MAEPEKLEVVYYSNPIPEDGHILTFLGLVFDRVHFPNVFIPTEGFDPDEVKAGIKRLVEHPDVDTEMLKAAAMSQAAVTPELRDFCHFAGDDDQVFGGDLDQARTMVASLHEQIHGPFPENFTPIWSSGVHQGLSQEVGVDYPEDYFYQCNALIYSAEHGIPILNAKPYMPIPAVTGDKIKNDATLLSTIMAMHCVSLVLPEIGELLPSQIRDLRNELASERAAFRVGLLQLAKEMNAAIESSSDEREIMRAAEFVAQTTVIPALDELRTALTRPRDGLLTRTWDLTKKVPGLVTAYATVDPSNATAAVLAALGDWFMASRRERPRSNMYYLLKLEERSK